MTKIMHRNSYRGSNANGGRSSIVTATPPYTSTSTPTTSYLHKVDTPISISVNPLIQTCGKLAIVHGIQPLPWLRHHEVATSNQAIIWPRLLAQDLSVISPPRLNQICYVIQRWLVSVLYTVDLTTLMAFPL